MRCTLFVCVCWGSEVACVFFFAISLHVYFSWISQYVLHLSWWSFWCCLTVFFGRLSGCLEFPIDRSAAGGNLCTSVPWLWPGVLHTGVGFICLFSVFAIRSVSSLRLMGILYVNYYQTKWDGNCQRSNCAQQNKAVSLISHCDAAFWQRCFV